MALERTRTFLRDVSSGSDSEEEGNKWISDAFVGAWLTSPFRIIGEDIDSDVCLVANQSLPKEKGALTSLSFLKV